MPVSPLCLVQDGAGPFTGTTNGVNVTAGNTISIKLNNPATVGQWFLQVTGTDETSTPPVLTGVGPGDLVTSPGTTVTFPMVAGAGRAFLLQSTTTGPGGPLTTTFVIYVLTVHGFRVGATGEQREGSTNFGWATITNPLIRTGAGVIRYNDSLVLPATGAQTAQQILDYLKAASASTSGGDLLIFTPSAPHVGNVWGDWAAMMAHVAAMPVGSNPRIRFTASFTIPLLGMPPTGWFQNLAHWESVIQATDAINIDIPDGVKIDMINSIQNGLGVTVNPTTEYGVWNWSLFPPGSGIPWIFNVIQGAHYTNLGTKAAIITPGLGAGLEVLAIMVVNTATISIPPNDTAPWLKSQNQDGVILAQFLNGPFGMVPDGWVVGTGAVFQYINGIDASDPFITPGPFVANYPAGWTGPLPTIFQASAARNVNYDDTLALPATGATNTQQIIDILKAGGSGGTPPIVVQLFGEFSGAEFPGFIEAPFRMGGPDTLRGVRIFRRYAGTAGTTRVNVQINGVSVFAFLAPTVTPGDGDYATSAVPCTKPVVLNDRIEVLLEDVETFSTGPTPQEDGPEGLTVYLYFGASLPP